VINDAEPVVSNPEISKLLKLWQRHKRSTTVPRAFGGGPVDGKGNLSEYHFEKELKLPHDLITPGTPGVPTGDVHSRLIDAVREIHINQ